MTRPTDLYILKNKDDKVYGSLEIQINFDILKLKDMSLTDAIVYLEKENIYYRVRTGALGVLTFKTQQ